VLTEARAHCAGSCRHNPVATETSCWQRWARAVKSNGCQGRCARPALSRNFQIGFSGFLLGAGDVEDRAARAGSQGEVAERASDHALQSGADPHATAAAMAATGFVTKPIADQPCVPRSATAIIAPGRWLIWYKTYPLVAAQPSSALRSRVR